MNELIKKYCEERLPDINFEELTDAQKQDISKMFSFTCWELQHRIDELKKTILEKLHLN